jgi:hypothetical protein
MILNSQNWSKHRLFPYKTVKVSIKIKEHMIKLIKNKIEKYLRIKNRILQLQKIKNKAKINEKKNWAWKKLNQYNICNNIMNYYNKLLVIIRRRPIIHFSFQDILMMSNFHKLKQMKILMNLYMIIEFKLMPGLNKYFHPVRVKLLILVKWLLLK